MKIRLYIAIFLGITSTIAGQSSYQGLTGWYHVSEVSMSGGGSSYIESFHVALNPAVIAGLKRSVETGMIRYPAGIGAETFMLVIPVGHQTYGFEIRHVGYGIFRGYDEQGFVTEDYSANDTWAVGTLALNVRDNRVRVGLSAGVLRSQIQDFLSYVVTVSAGSIYTIPRYGLAISAGLKNTGAVARTYTKSEQDLPATAFAGISKKLKYLPLRAGLDMLLQDGHKKPEAVLHLKFYATDQLQVLAGMTTRRFSQTTDFVFRNYISASSAGLVYLSKGISIKTGAHFISPGGLVIGVGIGMQF